MYPWLGRCRYHNKNGKVGYRTIHEGIVEADTSQRRPRLRVKARSAAKLQRFLGAGEARHKWAEIRWGQGWTIRHELQGGINKASTVAKSCGIVADENDIVGAHGDTNVLHGILDPDRDGYYGPQAHELTQFRQYFRFVTSNVSHWFAEHSTPNPLGIQPTATIVYGNKFTAHLSTE
ncbi:hypothetical protein SDRG_16633 [Saprolegnia diclina VS20]|uniref:Uncharacterized protein n=1 Tax=Saprolegnia diclina (strain VS20) TaxID=1156394 RepID=T0PJG9_SAPDV|nr:hypothetical protein SDRG_16633 [Saprolegnia diclina VS20]EQC25509.1 hypothetical protein SDRG_16633 [Saprolegnia diclina VS20]|eukprot:XP_008621073.1 hypothetical protein SDRG_16633 [Saprolegnia diclina VS20]